MSHPLVTIHGTHWSKILDHFKTSIAYLAYSKFEDEEIAARFTEQFVQAIENEKDRIFMATAAGITEYCNFYNIKPANGVHDEFKSIYFAGMAVSAKLVSLGLADLNKFHQKAMLGLLDFRLSTPNDVRRPELSGRIKSIIDNNAVDTHLGKYGWYLIYKCLFNSAAEKSNKI